MPGIITHLAYAEKYLKKNSVADFDKFVLGSVFPDVRYFTNVNRDLTHARFAVDKNFSGPDSFEAGWKSHIFLDERWNELMKNSIFYKRYKSDQFVASAAAKILEDELDYKRLEHSEKYLEIFKNQQLDSILGIPVEKINLYYSANADYLGNRDFKTFARHFLDDELITKIVEKIEEMKREKALVDFLSTALEKL